MTPQPGPPPALVAAVGALALTGYCLTLAPSLGFIDSGELAAAAHGFGIPHPTGYPLFVWLAGAWSHLPFGSVIVRLNLFSALATAAAAAVCADVMWRVLGRSSGLAKRARAAAALVAALAFAFNRTVWSNALNVEVYALHALLLLLVLDLLLRALEGGETRWRWLAFALGLSFSNHLTTIQLLPGLSIAWLFGRPRADPRRLPALFACFALGLAPYLYLPLRAAQDPFVNWGEPRTLGALLHHVSAGEYRGRFFMGLQPVLQSLGEFASGLPGQSGALTLALAALGAAALWRRDTLLAGVLGASMGTSIVVAASYAIPDIASYYLLAFVVLALLAGQGIAQLFAWPRTRALSALAGAGAVAALLAGNRDVSERGNFLVEDFAENMFRSLAPRAIVITYQWDHFVSPSLYLQGVLGRRSDVLVIDKRLCQREWYLRQLSRRHPEACAGAERELAALLEAPDAARIDAFLQAVVDRNFESRPLYVTVDLEASFPSGYRQVAEGLALRLYRPEALPSPDAPTWDDFRYRPFPRRDGWTDRLRQYYALMLMGRGAYLEQSVPPRPAAHYYERALVFEPSPNLRAELLLRLTRARAATPP